MSLTIQNLYASVQGKEILKGLSLEVPKGKIVAIMGPNGSGKSTLANVIMGHPKYGVTAGKILLDSKNITTLTPDKRARAGLFLSMQYPPEIHGVTVANLLRLAVSASTGENKNPVLFHKELTEKMKGLSMNPEFAKRSINAGFSGGEKKRMEILQLLALSPTYAILDETDSGLDVDALKIVAKGINTFHSKNNGVLIITHYNRILEYVRPDIIHIMKNGKIIQSGGADLATIIEKEGYKKFE